MFGADADAPLVPGFTNVQDLAASVHLFNAAYTGVSGVTLGAYAYVMNFTDVGNWDNNTFGVSAKGDLWGLTSRYQRPSSLRFFLPYSWV